MTTADRKRNRLNRGAYVLGKLAQAIPPAYAELTGQHLLGNV